MNDPQIKKLPQICLDAANRVLADNTDILETFGYSLLTSIPENLAAH